MTDTTLPTPRSDWQMVMETGLSLWALANDGLDQPADDAEVKRLAAKLQAAAERNGAERVDA